MAIHSSLGITDRRERGYPKLMGRSFDGLIVLFHDSTSGVVVHPGDSSDQLGYYSRNWTLGEFEDYLGSIVLENN